MHDVTVGSCSGDTDPGPGAATRALQASFRSGHLPCLRWGAPPRSAGDLRPPGFTPGQAGKIFPINALQRPASCRRQSRKSRRRAWT